MHAFVVHIRLFALPSIETVKTLFSTHLWIAGSSCHCFLAKQLYQVRFRSFHNSRFSVGSMLRCYQSLCANKSEYKESEQRIRTLQHKTTHKIYAGLIQGVPAISRICMASAHPSARSTPCIHSFSEFLKTNEMVHQKIIIYSFSVELHCESCQRRNETLIIPLHINSRNLCYTSRTLCHCIPSNGINSLARGWLSISTKVANSFIE